MADNFQSGHLSNAKWTVAGGVEQTLKITGWDETDEVIRHIITNTGTAGLAARLAGVRDIIVSLNADTDIDAMIHGAAPSIVPGNRGTLKLYWTASKFKSFGAIVARVRNTAAVLGKLSFVADFELTAIIDTTGTQIAITQPV